MARNRKNRWDEDAPAKAKGSSLRALRTTLLTLVIIVLVLYVAALIIGRTDGFRALLTPRLEAIFGFPVKVDRISLDLHFGLTLRDVRAAQLDPVRGVVFSAERIDIWWRWSDVLTRGRPGVARLEVVRPTLRFDRQPDGSWSPAPMSDLGSFIAGRLQLAVDQTNAVHLVTLQDRLMAEHVALSLRKADLSWWRGEVAPFASAEGVTLLATPIALPGRTVFHMLLKVSRAISADGSAQQHVVLETLDGEGFSCSLDPAAPAGAASR